MAVGEVGLSLDDFYDLTFDELSSVLEGYYKRINHEYRNGWEQARFIVYHGLLPHQKKGSTLKPQSIITFEWENKKKQKSIKELKEKQAELDKIFPKTIKG